MSKKAASAHGDLDSRVPAWQRKEIAETTKKKRHAASGAGHTTSLRVGMRDERSAQREWRELPWRAFVVHLGRCPGDASPIPTAQSGK